MLEVMPDSASHWGKDQPGIVNLKRRFLNDGATLQDKTVCIMDQLKQTFVAQVLTLSASCIAESENTYLESVLESINRGKSLGHLTQKSEGFQPMDKV